MDISWSKQLEQAAPRRFRAIFLNAEVVGALYMTDHNTEDMAPFVRVYAFNWVTGGETVICFNSNDIHVSSERCHAC